MAEIIKTTFQLRRGSAAIWTRNNPVLAKGEPGFEVDTYRLKIGDGTTEWNFLPYVGGGSAQLGYYSNGVFYAEDDLLTMLIPSLDRLYVDLFTDSLYYFNGTYVKISGEGNPTIASDTVAGIMKLYSTTGYNEDGTMTQKAITEELNEKVEARVDEQQEILIFTN